MGVVLHSVSTSFKWVTRPQLRAPPSVIAFRFIPNTVVTRPVEAIWIPFVQKPFFSLPYYVRLAMGWLALLGIVFGSAFGFKLEAVRIFNQLHIFP